MSFIIDKQTLDDLNIFGKRGKDSVYALFNRTITRGGAEQLEQMFRNPLSDATAIHNRISKIRFFQEQGSRFLFKADLFESATIYLEQEDQRSQLSHDTNALQRKIKKIMGSDTDLQLLRKGIMALILIFQGLQKQLVTLQQTIPAHHPYAAEIAEMQQLLALSDWEILFAPRAVKPSFDDLISFDKVLRFTHKDRVQRVLGYLYNMDVYIAIGSVVSERKFVFPELLEKDLHSIRLENVYHPELKNPVPNSISISPDANIIFLTGANMAGKSTFMKSFGIAVYLAHMGFPVPAGKMQFSVRDGMLTTINLPDNLAMGYSHFYVEVLRVKKVAGLLRQQKNMLIMFDEMFRGTNVKDAYEATVAITSGFAQKPNSLFVVSTHIMEAGEKLKEMHANINYLFLPTRLEGEVPVYTRILERGISADRHGMIIINNEGILQMLTNQ
jgi:DNA mismatch repair protein MutS